MLRKSTLIYAQFSDLQYNTVQSRSFLYYFTPTFAILNMVIAINTKALLPGKMEGYGYYIEEIFSRVAINHPEHQFYFLFDRAFDEEFIYAANIHPIIIKPQARVPLAWNIWYNWMLPIVLRRIRANVFVSPDGFCSLRSKVPQCIVVHDLAFLHYPKFIPKSHLRFYQKNIDRFLHKAKVIATVSAYSKQDIVEQYKIDPAKIHITNNAPNVLFQPLPYEEREQVKAKYSAGCEYFIYTGSIHPRKNPVHLLKAFSLFKKRQRSNMKLVFAGRLAWKTDEFTKLLSTFRFRNDVVLTGYLDKKELAALVASAYALIYPSFFEGFGVPPLEALQCGVPAIVSNNSAMPEIGADAYLYIEPENPGDIAEKMMLIYKDEALRSRLIENGKKRLSLFSWDTAAEKMWTCIELAASAE